LGVADAYTQRTAPRGWASLIVVVLFMGAVQLVCLGIVGEYIRLIFLESKGRPAYILRAYEAAAILPRRSRVGREGAVSHGAEG
jgi:dolichol-phosphate mannosyltransferase